MKSPALLTITLLILSTYQARTFKLGPIWDNNMALICSTVSVTLI